MIDILELKKNKIKVEEKETCFLINKKTWENSIIDTRKYSVGSSDIAYILNVSKLQNRYKLWNEKITPENKENLFLEEGSMLEPKLVEKFKEKHPELKKVYHNENTFIDKEETWKTATPDGFIVPEADYINIRYDNEDGTKIEQQYIKPNSKVLLEIKTSLSSAYNTPETPPLWTFLQVQWQMYILKADYAVVFVWHTYMGEKYIKEFLVEYDESVIHENLNIIHSFYESLSLPKNPYDPLEKLLGVTEVDDTTLLINKDTDFEKLARKYINLESEQKYIKKELELTKEKLLAEMGSNWCWELPDTTRIEKKLIERKNCRPYNTLKIKNQNLGF